MQIDNKWPNAINKSFDHIPDKVFIDRDGPGKYSYEYSEYEPRIHDLLYGHHCKENFIELFYSIPEIFAPINEIAWRVADATWQLRKSINDTVDYKDADFNRLFSKPNPLMDIKQFVWQSVVFELLTGANFQFFNKPTSLVDDYKNILTWSNLPSQNVLIDKNPNVDIYTATQISDFVKGYRVGNRRFEPSQVLPMLQLDVAYGNEVDKYKSPLYGASAAIRNLVLVYEARRVIYLKRGALGFIVSRKEDASGTKNLTPGDKKALQEDFQGQYGLHGNKDLFNVASVPVDFIKTSGSIQELQPFEETLSDAVSIYSTLGVPRHLVPSKDNSTFSNADADLKRFYGDRILPMAKQRAEAWTDYFKIPNRYIYPSYDHVALLQENEKEKAEALKVNTEVAITQYKEKFISKNDALALVGRESVPGGELFIGDAGSNDPLAVQFTVGALEFMKEILIDPALSDDAKVNTLEIIFKIPPADGRRMVQTKPTESNGNNNTAPQNTGTSQEGSADQL